MRRIILGILILSLLLAGSGATHYKKTAGPWIVEFNATEGMNFRNQYEEPTEEGYSWWMMTLIDKAGHEVAWFSFRSYSNPQKASEDSLDKMLDRAIGLFKVTSPAKTSTTADGTEARMGEGYSSEFSRNWRGVVWPYRSTFDSFTNTNMTKHYITFDSLQDKPEFESIINSVHATNVTNM